MSTRVISLRLKEDQAERLNRLARRQQRRPSESLSTILEEALRASEFPLVQFRDTILGREAYVVGTSTAVWEIAWLAQRYEGDVDRVASHLEWPAIKVPAALAYAACYPHEMADALADMAQRAEDLARQRPPLPVFRLDDETPSRPTAHGAVARRARVSRGREGTGIGSRRSRVPPGMAARSVAGSTGRPPPAGGGFARPRGGDL